MQNLHRYRYIRGLHFTMGNLALIKNTFSPLSPRNHLLRGQNYRNGGFYFLLWYYRWENWDSERLSNLPKVTEVHNFDLTGQEFKREGVKRSKLDQEVLFQMEADIYLF